MSHLELIPNHSLDSPVWESREIPLGRIIGNLRPTMVVWAIDVNEGSENNQSIEKLLEELSENRPVLVEPVHVLLPESTPLPREFFYRWRNELAFERAEKIRSYYRSNGSVLEPRILRKLEGSSLDAVGLLLEYADRIGADLIIAKNRRKKGFIRAFLASFTERLLARTKLPVLLFTEDSQGRNLSVSLHLPTHGK